MKRTGVVMLIAVIAGLAGAYYYHDSRKDVAVIDVMEYPTEHGQPSHIVLHTSNMIIHAHCQDSGSDKACRVFNAGEKVKIRTMGNTLIFTDHGLGEMHRWEIESERTR